MGFDKRYGEGLPFNIIYTVCNEAFAPSYTNANFSHALTAMDYLRDLEFTRRNALQQAAKRLYIKEDNWRLILSSDPDAYTWVKATEDNELKIERVYASLFFDTRIWVFIIRLLKRPS